MDHCPTLWTLLIGRNFVVWNELNIQLNFQHRLSIQILWLALVCNINRNRTYTDHNRSHQISTSHADVTDVERCINRNTMIWVKSAEQEEKKNSTPSIWLILLLCIDAHSFARAANACTQHTYRYIVTQTHTHSHETWTLAAIAITSAFDIVHDYIVVGIVNVVVLKLCQRRQLGIFSFVPLIVP